MPVYRPWRIDEDNEHRIVVKDDTGLIVHHAEYGDIPEERGAAFREQIVNQERENCHAVVAAINRIEPKTWR